MLVRMMVLVVLVVKLMEKELVNCIFINYSTILLSITHPFPVRNEFILLKQGIFVKIYFSYVYRLRLRRDHR